MRTLLELSHELAAGTRCRALVEQCLSYIDDGAGEGHRTFLTLHAEAALAAADRHDGARRAGKEASPFSGIPVSVKDLFDIAGDVTTAGSKALRDDQPARRYAA